MKHFLYLILIVCISLSNSCDEKVKHSDKKSAVEIGNKNKNKYKYKNTRDTIVYIRNTNAHINQWLLYNRDSLDIYIQEEIQNINPQIKQEYSSKSKDSLTYYIQHTRFGVNFCDVLRIGIEKDIADAFGKLAILYSRDYGNCENYCGCDEAKAHSYLRYALQNNSIYAHFSLKDKLLRQGKYDEVEKVLLRMDQLGSLQATYELSVLYLKGCFWYSSPYIKSFLDKKKGKYFLNKGVASNYMDAFFLKAELSKKKERKKILLRIVHLTKSQKKWQDNFTDFPKNIKNELQYKFPQEWEDYIKQEYLKH